MWQDASPVLVGLVPATSDLRYINRFKAWMAGTRPAMTSGAGHRHQAETFILSGRIAFEFPHSLP
jgi:hypothetical protein